eukprot:TRINITY_DN13700_c0_g1_i1.p1 TRINITY_DN13700_c0_g1~~TRINITY_DN13700_c0_g1_i1.p1  ORF type:complete len:105 (+),score=10.10 TRINITY_DN13700_c0_g1_i1:195-509(+)
MVGLVMAGSREKNVLVVAHRKEAKCAWTLKVWWRKSLTDGTRMRAEETVFLEHGLEDGNGQFKDKESDLCTDLMLDHDHSNDIHILFPGHLFLFLLNISCYVSK